MRIWLAVLAVLAVARLLSGKKTATSLATPNDVFFRAEEQQGAFLALLTLAGNTLQLVCPFVCYLETVETICLPMNGQTVDVTAEAPQSHKRASRGGVNAGIETISLPNAVLFRRWINTCLPNWDRKQTVARAVKKRQERARKEGADREHRGLSPYPLFPFATPTDPFSFRLISSPTKNRDKTTNPPNNETTT